MNTYTIIKGGAALVASAGASKVAREILYNLTSKPDSRVTEGLMRVGIYALSGAAGGIAAAHVEKKIDEYTEIGKKLKGAYEDAQDDAKKEQLKDKTDKAVDDAVRVASQSRDKALEVVDSVKNKLTDD